MNDRAGEIVRYMRCGTIQSARIIGWDIVNGPHGRRLCGSELTDPRYVARAMPNGMLVAVCASEIV